MIIIIIVILMITIIMKILIMIIIIMMIIVMILIIILTANLRTKILDFRGFYSSIILIFRGGSIGNFLESLSQAILVGRFLVGRLGVRPSFEQFPDNPDQVPDQKRRHFT